MICNHVQKNGVMQGLDEEGLRAYSGHLQQEFLRPDVSSAKRPSTNDTGPAPEDAARRYSQPRSTWVKNELSAIAAPLPRAHRSTKMSVTRTQCVACYVRALLLNVAGQLGSALRRTTYRVLKRVLGGSRWAVEQLSGGPMLTKGSLATRLGTLHFLALHAFFVTDASTEVRMACPWRHTGVLVHGVMGG